MHRKLTLFVLLLALLSCGKDNTITGELPDGQTVTASLFIAVEDQNGNPVQGAYVQAGVNMVQTDAWGVASFLDVELKDLRTLITVTKPGYYESYRVLPCASGSSQAITIQLTTLNTLGSFTASAGGTITVPGGGSIVFPAEGIADAMGTPYSGAVDVAAMYLDPYGDEVVAYAPNNFLGVDAAGDVKFLVNKGMMQVVLVSPSGEHLQLKNGSTAQLTIPIAAPDLSGAPSVLPMYHFDEALGGWAEEGEATLNGNTYQASVAHFSFWMCPSVYTHYNLMGQINCTGTPVSGTAVAVYNQWGAYLGTVHTDPTGTFSGQIPETLTFTLKVDDACGNTIYSAPIGPFTSNTTLPAIDVCTGGANYGTITGNVEDCNGNPDQNAYCRIQSQGLYKILPANLSGAFNASVLFCTGNSNATISCINPVTQLQSAEVVLPIAPAMNFGTVSTCSTAAEFCEFTFDGNPFNYNPNVVMSFSAIQDLTAGYIRLSVSDGQLVKFAAAVPGNTAGTYSMGGSPLSYTFQTTGPNSNSYLTVVITGINPIVGGVVEGYVQNGTYNDFGGSPHTVANCSFRFIIDAVQ